MEHTVRTAAGALLQTCQLLGLPLTVLPNSTLNEKFNIHSNVTISDSDVPRVAYVGIGNGGHKMAVSTDGLAIPEPVQHTSRNTSLYNQLPFVLRLPSDDLTAQQRANYRLRRLETHDGTVYVAYYLKVIDLSATVPQIELRTVADGVTTSTPFTYSVSDMNPLPPAINPGGVLVTTGDYIAATAKVPFVMNEEDIREFLNVCNIIYGNENYAIISELGLCSGIDRSLTGDFNGIVSGYTDAVAVQITNFISSFFAVKFVNNNLRVDFDIGSVEPLLALR